MFRWPAVALTFICAANAQDAGFVDTKPVEHIFAESCDVVRPAMLAYFQKQDWPLTPTSSCTNCLTGTSRKLHDGAGHRLTSNRNAIKNYTTYALQYEQPGPLAFIVHPQMQAKATLHLDPMGSSCHIAMHFLYSWYGAELVLGFPVDGDTASGYSNGKLETSYLHALQQHFVSNSSNKSVSLH